MSELTCAATAPCTRFRRHQHIVRLNQPCEMIYRIDEGWACRYALLGSGRRQITALYLPGEYCEPQWLFEGRSHAPIIALTDLRATLVPIKYNASSGAERCDALKLIAAMVDLLNRQAEWIVSLGRRTARERVCAVLLDIFQRLNLVGRVYGQVCRMPLTQVDLADVVGLTPVPVNRVLKDLRSRGILELRTKLMRVPDPEQLQRLVAARA